MIHRLLACLCLCYACAAAEWQTISPDHELINYRGTNYPQVSAEQAELLRLPLELLEDDQAQRNHGYNAGKARSTSCVRVVITTDSPRVRLHFKDGTGDPSGAMGFAIYQNGVLSEQIKTNPKQPTLELSATTAGATTFEVRLPVFRNAVLTGIDIEAGSQLLTPPPARQ
ncbi:MAG: hypothetical protein ACYTF0_08615, partial [Planctomycetota bacterium]